MNETQAGYYKRENFNPTAFDISGKAEFGEHQRKRFNLYSKKLKIPKGFWEGKSVFEVGCSSGENALVLAELGAKFTFVDPMAISLERLENLFQERGYASQITAMIQDEIQNVNIDEKYDFIIAEGFLYTLQDRKTVLHKLLGSLNPHGLLSLSTLDPVGNFAEFLKKVILIHLCRQGQAVEVTVQMEIARKLFSEDYHRIPHSRPFESWVRDNFLNPTYELSSMWSIKEILKDCTQFCPRVYSSWPRIEHGNDVSWYKQTVTYEEEQQMMLNAYSLRLPGYFHGKTLADGHPLSDMGIALDFETRVLSCMEIMDHYIKRQESDLSGIVKELETMKNAAEGLQEKAMILPILQEAIALFNNPNIDSYLMAENIRDTWGAGYPYYVLERSMG